jgi:hypothetical protein
VSNLSKEHIALLDKEIDAMQSDSDEDELESEQI